MYGQSIRGIYLGLTAAFWLLFSCLSTSAENVSGQEDSWPTASFGEFQPDPKLAEVSDLYWFFDANWGQEDPFLLDETTGVVWSWKPQKFELNQTSTEEYGDDELISSFEEAQKRCENRYRLLAKRNSASELGMVRGGIVPNRLPTLPEMLTLLGSSPQNTAHEMLREFPEIRNSSGEMFYGPAFWVGSASPNSKKFGAVLILDGIGGWKIEHWPNGPQTLAGFLCAGTTPVEGSRTTPRVVDNSRKIKDNLTGLVWRKAPNGQCNIHNTNDSIWINPTLRHYQTLLVRKIGNNKFHLAIDQTQILNSDLNSDYLRKLKLCIMIDPIHDRNGVLIGDNLELTSKNQELITGSKLKEISGDLTIKFSSAKNTVKLNHLESIGGDLRIMGFDSNNTNNLNKKLEVIAPNLSSIIGSVYILNLVGNELFINSNAVTILGNLSISGNSIGEMGTHVLIPNLERLGDSLYVNNNSGLVSINFRNLREINGSMLIDGNESLGQKKYLLSDTFSNSLKFFSLHLVKGAVVISNNIRLCEHRETDEGFLEQLLIGQTRPKNVKISGNDTTTAGCFPSQCPNLHLACSIAK